MTKTVKYILLTQNIFINNKTRCLQRLVSNLRSERVVLTFALTLTVDVDFVDFDCVDNIRLQFRSNKIVRFQARLQVHTRHTFKIKDSDFYTNYY